MGLPWWIMFSGTALQTNKDGGHVIRIKTPMDLPLLALALAPRSLQEPHYHLLVPLKTFWSANEKSGSSRGFGQLNLCMLEISADDISRRRKA